MDDLSQNIEILISDPKKIGDGIGAYVAYKVITRVSFWPDLFGWSRNKRDTVCLQSSSVCV